MQNSGINLLITQEITDTVQPQSTKNYTFQNHILGQTITITYFLTGGSAHHIMQIESCSPTITVKKPNGEVYATETMPTAQNTITIPNADAGTWTYEVDNNCDTSKSYQINTSASGTGIIVGTVMDTATQTNLSGVNIITDIGGVALSVGGHYVLVSAAGIYTVTAFCLGYETNALTNVTVNAGATVTVDFSLTLATIEDVQFVGLTTNLADIPQAGDSIAFTADGIGPGTIYYKLLYKAGYGSAAWNTNQWVPFQNFSTNNAATFSFPSADNYVVIMQASDDPNVWSAGDPQGGITVNVTSSSDVQLISLTSNFSSPLRAGDAIVFTANATGSGTRYYRFLYKAGYGTAGWNTNQWVPVQYFSTNNTATFSFPSEDNYCVIVQASDDPNVWIPGDPQGGITVNVESQ